MDKNTNSEFNLYKDIQGRTDGEIYIGVVGPVRTGKSTFIKRFMDICVIPMMEDGGAKERLIDELPQSAQGKTIMTTEPKFIPQEAAQVTLEDGSSIRMRMIDCVGFMVDGASGHMEGNGERMVKTPWSEEEIPFVDAARIGTKKVIHEHATIGVVVTTDGTVGEIPRENYLAAEKQTIDEISGIGKPFVIVLNCERPYSEEIRKLKDQMEQEYQAPVIPVNCKQMRKEDINQILEAMLYEFPVSNVAFFIPGWTEMLSSDHWVKKMLINRAREIMGNMIRMRDVYQDTWKTGQSPDAEGAPGPVTREDIKSISLEQGTVALEMEVDETYYYQNISEMTGIPIEGEYQLIAMVKELAAMKQDYEQVKDAMDSVHMKGYGVVMPKLSDIKMENPVLIRHGNKFGVKIHAISPSVHMIRANIETEIAPIVGSEEQAQDLIDYIKKGEESQEGIWTTNIFGKSVGELMEDGIKNKIALMDDECQMKLQDTMQKIVNDSNGGMICIII